MADQDTFFYGNISAEGFNGGFVEVSGKENLFYRGYSSLIGRGGKSGSLLLDPQTILIQAGGVNLPLGQTFGSNIGIPQTIDGATLAMAISGASVTLQANSDITFNDNVAPAMAGDLICQAGCSIIFNAGRSVNLNGGNFTGTINFDNPPVITLDRSCPTTTNPQFLMNAGSSILTQGGTIIIDHQMVNVVYQGEVIINGTLRAGSSSISIT